MLQTKLFLDCLSTSFEGKSDHLGPIHLDTGEPSRHFGLDGVESGSEVMGYPDRDVCIVLHLRRLVHKWFNGGKMGSVDQV